MRKASSLFEREPAYIDAGGSVPFMGAGREIPPDAVRDYRGSRAPILNARSPKEFLHTPGKRITETIAHVPSGHLGHL